MFPQRTHFYENKLGPLIKPWAINILIQKRIYKNKVNGLCCEIVPTLFQLQ